MPYKSNRNVVYSCKFHVVWCPKYRRQILLPPIDETWKQVIRKVCDRTRSEILEMEVMPDHVHLLVECDPQFGIHRFIQLVKGNTSHVLRSAFPMLKRRLPSLWTNSYFVATVGGAPLAVIQQYIESQKAE
ncbi:MAG TPA: IS200/IS605 family transposase [Bryobacteraceae bacterium]|nr:IS200/IS605 family transposase [Bryobacteraceae bacterium]